MLEDNYSDGTIDDDFEEQGYLWLCDVCKNKPTFESIYELFNHKESHRGISNSNEETLETNINQKPENEDFEELQNSESTLDFERVDVPCSNPTSPSSSSDDVPLSTLIAGNAPSEISVEKCDKNIKQRRQRTVKNKTNKSNKKEKDCKQVNTTVSNNIEKENVENNKILTVDKENDSKEINNIGNTYVEDLTQNSEENDEINAEGKENVQEENKESTSKVSSKNICKICNTEFSSRIKLSSHKKTHLFQNTGCFKCETCGKMCTKYDNFTRHLTIHLSDRKKNHQCAQCFSSFYNLADLKRHLALHLPEKPFKCDQCGESFLRQDNLLIHAYKHTGIKYKKFACKDCDKVLNSPSALVMHSKTHSIKTIFCPEPGCKFSCHIQSQLRQHQRKHTGEKPFQCAKCGRCFSRSNDMKNHVMNIHDDVKPYKCPSCPKQFALIGNLKIHSVTHTNERPFLCAQCGKSFKQSSTFRKHCKIVHNPWRTKKLKKSKDLSSVKEEVVSEIEIYDDRNKNIKSEVKGEKQ